MRKEDVEKLKNTIIDVHDYIIGNYGGEFGIRDDGGVYHSAYRLLFHMHKTKDPFEVGAFALEDIAQNHYFIDGNKRTAFVMAFFMLRRKGKYLTKKYQDSKDFVIKIADSQTNKKEIIGWLKKHTKDL